LFFLSVFKEETVERNGLLHPAALGRFPHARDGGLGGDGGGRVEGVGAAGDDLLTALALPDASALALHAVLPAEDAIVLRVLLHLHLLDVLTQRRAVTRAVLPADTHFLRAPAHLLGLGPVETQSQKP